MARSTWLLVMRREFRTYFFSPIAYIVIGLFLATAGAITFVPFFITGRAELRGFFSILPIIMAFIVPAITMRLYSDEYRTGTFEITKTLPISASSLIAGKYCATLLFVAVMLLPTISYPIFVSSFGNLDWGPVVGAYVGSLFLGAAFCAIGLFASSLAKTQIVGYVVGTVLCLFLAGIDRALILFPGLIAGVFQYVSAGFHFQNIAKGVFDSRDLIYFVSIPALALYATLLIVATPRIRDRDRLTSTLQLGAHASFLIFVAIANFASGSILVRADLTEDRIHSLSAASIDTVESLREPVTVRAFFSRNLPSPYNTVEQSLRDLLVAYSARNPSQFNYAFHSMTKLEEALSFTTDEDLSESERLAQDYSIFPIQIQEVDRDEVKLSTVYMGVAVIYGDSAERIDAATSSDQLEYELTSKIANLSARSSKLLAMTTPINLELFLSSTLRGLSAELDRLPGVVESIVRELNPEFYDRLSVTTRDPSQDPQALESALELQLAPLVLATGDEEPEEGDYAYATLVLTVENTPIRLDLLFPTPDGYQIPDPDIMKQGIRVNLNALLSPQRTVGYVVGNDTPPYRGFSSERTSSTVVSDLSVFFPLVTREHEIKGFFAENGVPEGVNTVMVVGPRGEFSEYDLFVLDQFLMRGGSLILLIDSYNIEIGPGNSFFWERTTGIEEMIEHYGVRLTRSYLLDEKSFIYREADPRGSVVSMPVYSAPEISGEQFNQELEFLRNIGSLVLTNVTPLELTDDRPSEVDAYPMIESSDGAWALEGDLNINSPLRSEPPPASLRSRFTMAYLLEGSFESYFTDRELPSPPETDDDEDEETDRQLEIADGFLSASAGGRLMVLGTSSLVGANILGGADAGLPSATLLLNMIDYMNGSEGLAEVRAKGVSVSRLDETSAFTKAFTKYFNIGGLPIIVVLAGVAVWLINRARRGRIRALFAGENRE